MHDEESARRRLSMAMQGVDAARASALGAASEMLLAEDENYLVADKVEDARRRLLDAAAALDGVSFAIKMIL